VLLGFDIASFVVDGTTGNLTQIAGQTITIPANASTWDITVDPTNSFVIITDNANDAVSSFKIGSTGALTNAGTAMATAGSGLYELACDPAGKFCYATGNVVGNVTCFTIGAGGSLAMASTANATPGARSVVVDPAGSYVYVGNESDQTLKTYARDASNGSLTAVGSVKTTGPITTLTIDASGKNLYAGRDVSGFGPSGLPGVDMFKLDGKGGLQANTPASTPCGAFPVGLSIDASGTYAFDANYGAGTITAFKIDPKTGIASTNGTAVTVPNSGVPHGLALVK
jgi:6-phosphogluconolactonase